MCGIFGLFLSSVDSDLSYLPGELERANIALARRGPDSSRIWLSPSRRFGLGHTLLSITETKENGLQPVFSNDGRYVLVFNGEIYNHQEFRQLLSANGVRWETDSDTESLLKALTIFGIEKTLSIATGMFAFAFLDLELEKLTLCRDRFGEKPLYLGVSSSGLFFTSSLTARPRGRKFDYSLSTEGLSFYQRYGFIPAPYCIYSGIIKVLPGHLVELPISEASCPRHIGQVRQKPWWRMDEAVSSSLENPIPSFGAQSAIEGEIRRAVALQVNNRVDTAVLLSGGIDSSLIASVASEMSRDKLRTFTVGFDNPYFDESAVAENTARKLNTDHETVRLTHSSVSNILSEIGQVYDEPFSDSSQIPSLLVTGAIKSAGIKVALTGDGGMSYSAVITVISTLHFLTQCQRHSEVYFGLSERHCILPAMVLSGVQNFSIVLTSGAGLAKFRVYYLVTDRILNNIIPSLKSRQIFSLGRLATRLTFPDCDLCPLPCCQILGYFTCTSTRGLTLQMTY